MNRLYPAKERYRDEEEARSYEARRFKGLIGRIVNGLELRSVRKGLAVVGSVGRALDVAAGTGRITRVLAPVSQRVVAVDISRAMLSRLAGGSPVIGDVEHLPFADRSFDIVTCVRLFGHLPPDTRRRALSEIARVSRKYILVAYYHRRLLAPVKDLINAIRGQNAPRYLVSRKEFKDDLRTCGLRLRCSSGTGPQLSGVIHLLERG